MESSESEDTASEDSSTASSSKDDFQANVISQGVMNPPASESGASLRVSRSREEWALIRQTGDRLNQTLELLKDHLGEERYAYEVNKVKRSLQFHMCRARQKVAKIGSMNATLIAGSDVASLISSVGSVAPLGQRYPSNLPALPGRVPNMSFGPPPHANELYSTNGVHSSGYSSGPSGDAYDPYGPPVHVPGSSRGGSKTLFTAVHEIPGASKTLLAAINETNEGSDLSSSSSPQRQTQKRLQNAVQMIGVPGTSGTNRKPSKDRRPGSPFAHSEDSDSSTSPKRSKPVSKSSANLPKAVPKLRNIVTLKSWRLTLIGEDIGVVGVDRNGCQVRSGAVTKYAYPTVFTTKGQFQLDGRAQFGERASQTIVKSCQNGFPRQWKRLSKKWLAEKQQKKSPRKPSPKKAFLAGSKSSPKRKPTPSSGKKTAKPQKRRSKSMEVPKNKRKSLPEAESEDESQSQRNRVKKKSKDAARRSKSEEVPKNKRKSLPEVDSEDESEPQRNPVKKKSKDTAKRSKPEEIKRKKKELREVSSESEAPESEDEGSEPGVEHQKDQRDRRVQHQDSNEEVESADSIVDSPVRRTKSAEKTPGLRQVQGSDTSWCSTPAKFDTPTPKDAAKKKPQKRMDKPVQKRADKLPAAKDAPRANKKILPNHTAGTNSKNPAPHISKEPATKGKTKPLSKKSPVQKKPSTSKQLIEESRPPPRGGLFSSPCVDDDDLFRSVNPFGGRSDDGCSAGGRSMTPNALLESCALGNNVPVGRFTPPMQSMQHLFNSGGRNKRHPSINSPSSSILNSSRDNPVLKRMTKDVTQASKKRTNKKHPGQNLKDDFDSNPEVADLMKAFKNTNSKLPTPAIVKKHFRRDASGSSDEEDPDESQVY